MGIPQSTLEEMQKATNFSDEELHRLFKRFKEIDLDGNKALSVDEFMAIPELENNPLVRRVIATMDSDKNGEVDFKEFVTGLAVFANQDNIEDKYKFTFNLYDVNGDGFISNGDLFTILKTMVGNNLSDVQLQQLVDRTILQGDKDKDGRLSYEEFVEMVQGTEIESKLTIELS